MHSDSTAAECYVLMLFIFYFCLHFTFSVPFFSPSSHLAHHSCLKPFDSFSSPSFLFPRFPSSSSSSSSLRILSSSSSPFVLVHITSHHITHRVPILTCFCFLFINTTFPPFLLSLSRFRPRLSPSGLNPLILLRHCSFVTPFSPLILFSFAVN